MQLTALSEFPSLIPAPTWSHSSVPENSMLSLVRTNCLHMIHINSYRHPYICINKNEELKKGGKCTV